MSKKSYKRHQNRLYREIKRRMLLEYQVSLPLKVHIEQRKIDTLKIRQLIPSRMISESPAEFMMNEIKSEIAKKIANKLYEEKYIVLYTHNDDLNGCIEIDAKIDVVRPSI